MVGRNTMPTGDYSNLPPPPRSCVACVVRQCEANGARYSLDATAWGGARLLGVFLPSPALEDGEGVIAWRTRARNQHGDALYRKAGL